MIDVTVKTLDSQNHRYSVTDDITVKQFKDRIANSVSIPPDKQRLIYCGRVLQDDKNLSDYNVHEKVIHLVMRAPPQPSNRGNDRRGNGSVSNNSSGIHLHHRATTNQGPSSSGVRLQQAKSMLDKAAEVLNRLEASSNRNSPQGNPVNENAGISGNSESPDTEMMETCERTSGPEEAPCSRPEPQSEEQMERQAERETQSAPPSSQELDSLYQEMDALNNMDPPMVEGGHLMTSAIGNPLMGALSNSLQGGLFQAASAAFVSALSSLGGTPPTSSSASTSSPTATPTTTETSSSSTPVYASSTDVPSTTSSQTSSTIGPSNRTSSTQAREGPPTSTGNHPLSGVRGITVRITNRGSQRSSGIRLEHPRCSVMVEVLDQYEEIQRRLQPFLQVYHRCMVEDRTYEESDRQVYADQLLIWRVSAAMHYVSHALHAISDIMIDLRRPPPRQLRARPFIIPQPALVQAQINVAPSSEGPPTTSNARASGRRSSDSSSAAATQTTTTTTSSNAPPSSGPSQSSPATATASSSSPSLSRSLVNMSEMMEDDNGVVFMHVGPNGITIDSLSAEGGSHDSGSSPPPELIQNLMSSLTSQLGMRLGSPSSHPSSTSSAVSNASSTSPPSTPGVRRVPVHNSQAAGNSGTSTTNATQTRVTPRAQQVHVTPLHVPGMGMTQFDPFLPCQSHHVRPAASRRRHRATNQTSSPTAEATQEEARAQGTRGEEESRAGNQSSATSQSTPNEGSNSSLSSGRSGIYVSSNETSGHLSLFANLLTEIMSSGNNEHQSEEEQQQERMFAQLVRGVMSEVSGSMSERPSGQQQRQQTSLQEFLEPFSGGGFFSEGERDSIFAHLFNAVSQSLTMCDLIELFFGDAASLNHLFGPLQELVREKVLRGMESSEANMDVAIDEILSDLDPHLMASAENAVVHDGIDYVNTIHNFIRHRLHDVFNLILNHREEGTFGSVLVSLLRRIMGEFVALSVHCFTDGAQGLERLVQGRVQSIMSGMSPSIQAWSVNTSIMQLRSMMAHLAITDDHIRRYIISPDEGRRMDEARQSRRVLTTGTVPGPQECGEILEENQLEQSQVNGLEVMDVDEVEGVKEVTPAKSDDQAVAIEEPLSVTIGSQPWHSAVPQDWIPVITRDVDRQRRGVPDTNLSDGYLCGVPLKRRKIATQSKPHGSVQHVLQDTLRQSLRSTGANRTLIESVSNEVSGDLGDSFATHVRCALRDELEANEDFIPEKFPKSEQKIRKKR